MDLSGEAAGKIEQEDYARTTCPPLHIGLFWAPPCREKKGVLSAWETERSTRTHRAGTLLVQAVRSRVLSPPPPLSSPELELCCCPSAGHYLPPSSLPLPCFVLSSPLPMSSFLCGRRSSSHFGLPKDGDRGKKKFLLAFSSSVSSAEFVQMSVFFFYEDLMPSESKIKHENQLSYIQRWETGQAPCAA